MTDVARLVEQLYADGCQDPAVSSDLALEPCGTCPGCLCAEAADVIAAQVRQLQQVEVIAEEALSEWDYASQYKGDYLRKKHGDVERIDELRAKLASALGEGRT